MDEETERFLRRLEGEVGGRRQVVLDGLVDIEGAEGGHGWMD